MQIAPIGQSKYIHILHDLCVTTAVAATAECVDQLFKSAAQTYYNN